MTEISELYDKKVICPICNTEFETKKVRSAKLRLIRRDEDFLAYYAGESPLKYNVFVCPNCGYSASESKFDSITSEEKEIILKEITSKWNKRSYGDKRTWDEAIKAYKLALYIGEVLNYKKVELGSLCLSIGWLYRIEEKQQNETRFLRLARDLFEEGFYKESLVGTNMDELKLGYLIGEISRRLGDKEQALKWFNTVLSNPSLKVNPMLENMIREQWRLIREG